MEEKFMTGAKQEEQSQPEGAKAELRIGTQIARLRKEKGMTQEQLAGQLGVTFQAVSKWENAAACPDIALLPVLADLFGITLDELFGRIAPETISKERKMGEDVDDKDRKSQDQVSWGDDGKFRIVVYRGRSLLKTEEIPEKIRELTVTIHGVPADLISYLSVECGDVAGNVTAGNHVSCGSVEGSVTAGKDVSCETVGRSVSAGGNVDCTDVEGDVHAEGMITCADVGGNVNAGGGVECNGVEGSVRAGGDVTCGDVGGSVKAGCNVECPDVEGSVSAGGDVNRG